MKRKAIRKLIAITLIFMAFMVLNVGPVFAEPEETEEVSEEAEGELTSGGENPEGENAEAEEPEPDLPELQAQGGAVYCRNTGEFVFVKNGDKRLSPYSITKILTCLLAIQKLPMDQVVTVSAAAAYQDGTTMNLKEGEEVTVEQLLYGTMILSGNDAAYALGEAVSGDVNTFVDLMNETVSNLGCKNTHFVNPNGNINDVEQQYTTAKDFVEICKLAFNNKTFMQIAGATEYDMPATNLSDAYTMEGHNELLMEGRDEYIAGKTGYWHEVGATIAMDYYDGSLELIAVVLGGDKETRGEDCDKMVDYALAHIEGLKVVKEGEAVADVRVRHGAVTKIQAVTGGESYVYLPKAASKELIQLVAELNQNTDAPIKAGDQVGVYKVFLADELLDEVPLVSPVDVEEGWLPSYIGISNQTTLIIAGLMAALILLLIVRGINKSRMRRRKRAEVRRRVQERNSDDY